MVRNAFLSLMALLVLGCARPVSFGRYPGRCAPFDDARFG